MIQRGRHTIETPCHQLLDYEEHDDCCDIVLDGYFALSAAAPLVICMPTLTYIVAVLNIEEAPESVSGESNRSMNPQLNHIHRHNGINDCEPSIEG